MAMPSDIYPVFTVKHIQNPNRIWAIPILGFLVKWIICIPQIFMLFFLGIAIFFVTFIINPFVVLFTGNYMELSYTLCMYYLVLSTKTSLYIMGLSDKYPGFNLAGNADFTLSMDKPTYPSRLLAIPVLGGFTRFLLIYGFFIYLTILSYAAWLGVVLSSFAVLFTGKYPESTYELTRDMLRLQNASTAYLMGLSDEVPSSHISMNHKNVKILLVMVFALVIALYYVFVISLAVSGSLEPSMQGSSLNPNATAPLPTSVNTDY